MNKDEDVSAPQGRKPKPESYAYSWFLPAEGHNGSAIVSHEVIPDPEASAAEAEDSEIVAMEARTEKWRHSGENVHKSVTGSWWIDLTRLRFAGIAGWSAMAAVGGLMLSTRAGPFPGLQLGILGGVWVGISVLIWFLPKKL
jgi:hypothetical protein